MVDITHSFRARNNIGNYATTSSTYKIYKNYLLHILKEVKCLNKSKADIWDDPHTWLYGGNGIGMQVSQQRAFQGDLATV